MVNIFKPQKTILTNLHTDLDYNKLKKKLPKNIIPAHDGLFFWLYNLFNFIYYFF